MYYLPRRVLARGSAWIGARDDGAATEVAAAGAGVILVVCVEGVAGMVMDSVGLEAAPAIVDRRAVRSALPARPIQPRQQHRVGRRRVCHAPAPTRDRYEAKT